jgi:hypothetical protein
MKQRLLLLAVTFFSLSSIANVPAAYKPVKSNHNSYDALFRVGTFSGNPDGYCRAVFLGEKKYLIRLSSNLDYVVSIEEWYSGSDCSNFFITTLNIIQDDDYNPTVQLGVIFDDPYYYSLGWGMYQTEYNLWYQGTETYFLWGTSGQ